MKKYNLKYYIDVHLGITHAEAAKNIGISRAHLNRVLNGRVTPGKRARQLIGVWSAGRVEMKELMGRGDE